MQVRFPYSIDSRGRTAAVGEEEHVKNLIEQVLFTAPGERVNRPTLGSGLLGLVFEPGGDALVAATQQATQAALQLWLGERITVEAVEVVGDESKLAVTVRYTIARTGQRLATTVGRER